MNRYFQSLPLLLFIIGSCEISAQGCPVSVSGPGFVCAGFQVTLTASGANSYTWTSSTFSAPVIASSVAVGPGSYTVTGSTANCTGSFVASVALQPPLNISVTQSSGTTCIASNSPPYSKPVALTASGASFYTWFASLPLPNMPASGPSVTTRPYASCCYTVIGATSTCSGSAMLCISVIPQYSISVSPTVASICEGSSVQLSVINVGNGAVGPPTAFTYSWHESAPGTLNNNLTASVMATPQGPASYTAMVYDAGNCISLPVTVSVSTYVCTEIKDQIIHDLATVFPNPFSSHLSVKCGDCSLISISDALGRELQAIRPYNASFVVDTSTLLPGIYFVSITDHEQKVTKIKVFKN